MPLTYLVVKWIKRREPSYQAALEEFAQLAGVRARWQQWQQ